MLLNRYILILFIAFVFITSCKNKDSMIKYEPIGYFETEYTMQTGAPRQGMLIDNAKGIINLKEEYVKGLDYLTSFEYIWVIYHFSEAKGWESEVIPPDSDHEFGVFATRSPRRPNPIGLSLIKLEKIEGVGLGASICTPFGSAAV